VAGVSVRLADLTTLRVGGTASHVVEAGTEAELVEAVRDADGAGTPALLVAGGSNLLVGDADLDAPVVLVRTRGVAVEADTCGGAWVTVAAGEPWDDLVARAVAEGWSGIEALSGIPGSVGATPLQNVGAYGQEVADSIARVRTWDRLERTQRSFAAADCGFAYRTSRFKQEPGRYAVLEVTFQLRLAPTSPPIRYAELARTLGVEVGERAPSTDVREAVLALRRSKGMVLDDADHDTWSAGSFFTNPVLDADAAARLPADAPRWPTDDGRTKTSAAWLIEHAGFGRGYGAGPARLSTKHPLALTNRGGATAADVLALAREVRDGVRRTTGILLEPEPVLVGCSLDPA
jgi:UDP-N-acetylmuramate dehydrogenase